MLKKIERLSLVEQVVKQMEQLIESGHWGIGDRLPAETQLMKEFGVSRNTLREAVGGLVHAGLLEAKQGSGTIVKSSSAFGVALHRQIEKSSIMETLEVRLALEREAAQLAAIRRDEHDIEAMTQSIELCREASLRGDIDTFLHADIQFHKAMVKASHNMMLQRIYEHITEPLRSSIEQVMRADDFRENGEIHHDLLEAIKMQDVQAAIRHVNTYINGFRDKIELIQED